MNLTSAGQNIVADAARRYNLSQAAVEHMLVAVNNGAGTMAQFNCSELGGSGQWMRGGMTMVGDMFNYGLQATVDGLCNELSNALAQTQMFVPILAGTPGSNHWWPADLGNPFSSGAQSNIRYAVFPQRLAVELNGQVTVYDTLDHQIGGVSQQQGGDTSLSFSSQYGTVSVSSLPVVSGPGLAPATNTNFANPEPSSSAYSESAAAVATPVQSQDNNNFSGVSADEVFAMIEKLARLQEIGALTVEEYQTKKAELLSRI